MTDQGIDPGPDKIVRRLEEFPELAQALRNGDQSSARLLFAQLFEDEDGDGIALPSGVR